MKISAIVSVHPCVEVVASYDGERLDFRDSTRRTSLKGCLTCIEIYVARNESLLYKIMGCKHLSYWCNITW